ncbi:MAG: hypothetical protein GTO22_10860, partial [Gemmatimonadales bacterium]|nr:hypothetical protein [Gemmatimonadales bacterium]
MQRRVSRVVLPTLVLGLVCLLAGRAAATVSVATDDGVVLTLNDDGSWNSLTIDGAPVPELPGVTGGFVIARMEGIRIPWQRNVFYAGTPVTGTATQQGSDVHFTASTEGIWFDITLSGGGPYIGVDGTVTGPGTDRVFIVYFRIPVDADGWKWWDHVNMYRTIANGSSNWYLSNRQNPNVGVFHQARHPDLSLSPFGSISRTSGAEMGISLSPLLYPPCAYAIQYNSQGGFWIEFELGTTPQTTKHPNTADFHFILYRHDPDWGVRSAAKRYYGFFPQWFQQVSRGGNWWWDKNVRPTNPEDFALVYFETYYWDDQYTIDANMYTCKYQEPWCWHLPYLEEATIEQKALDIPENDVTECIGKGQSVKESAQSTILSGAKNHDGSYIGPDDPSRWVDGDWGCGTTWRWITNPDPEIPNWRSFTINGAPGRNRGESVQHWEWYRQWGQEPGPGDTYSGLYHDSVGGGWAGWGAVHNFEPNHWGTYDYNPAICMDRDQPAGVVCMWPIYSNIEFAKVAHEQMASEDRVVMGNAGAEYALQLMAPFMDMFGAGEHFSSDSTVLDQSITRMIAYQKPCSYLLGGRSEAAIKSGMLLGIY